MNPQVLNYISFALSFFAILALVWTLLRLKRLDRIRKEFFSSELEKDLEQVLVEQNRAITSLRSDLTELSDQVRDIKIINQSNFQKVGFLRFNPFDDAGGNISFALCLLNGKDDGVVVSSLHGREGTRVYAKSIKSGISESKLTDEEQQAIDNAK